MRILEWLLGLRDIRIERDAPLLVRWENPVPAWGLLAIGLIAGAWVVLVYSRERTSAWKRVPLCLARGLLIALIVAVFCRPMLVFQHNRIEPSYVALLLDNSMSMQTTDQYSDDALYQSIARGIGAGSGETIEDIPRIDLVKRALLRDGAAPLSNLLRTNGMQVVTFAGTAEPRVSIEVRGSPDEAIQALQDQVADGSSTDLAGAIQYVLGQSQGRRLAAIVISSDGQSTQSTPLKGALDQATDRQIPIFPIRIGSPLSPLDIEVGLPRYQTRVFANDVFVVEVPLVANGLRGPTEINVRLIDERSGESVADEKVTLDPQTPSRTVELRTIPTRIGEARFAVNARPLPEERLTENNSDAFDVTVLQDRLRVLFVDGYPRFEYRFLKNALMREKTMEMSALLLEADEDFVQEGTEPIRRFPESPEELNRYDAVLFGDVDPRGGWLSPQQMNMLLDYVGNEGGGFGLVAGERFAPYRFLGTPLERLIPVTIDPQFHGRYDTTLTTGFSPLLTPEGRESRVFRFTPDRDQSDALFGSLPEIYWVARSLGVKPGASALAEHPTMRSVAGAMPIVVLGRYGAGRLFFQATDDTWRWRRHTGELVYDGYWIRVLREIARSFRSANDRRFVLRTDRRVYSYGQPVQTQLEVFDPRILGEIREAILMRATQVSDDERTSSAQASATSSSVAGEFEVFRLGGQSSLFEGIFVPPRPGRFTIAPVDIPPQVEGRSSAVAIRVNRPDLEARRPQADHEVLQRIAASTGGRVLDLDQLGQGFSTIRDRSVQIPDDIVEPLWDSKLVFAIFVLMISMEWGLRKVFGLL